MNLRGRTIDLGRGPFDTEVLGKTVRLVAFDQGDVLVLGSVHEAGMSDDARALADFLNYEWEAA